MDKRDAETKFNHQRAMHDERPIITPELIQSLNAASRVIEAKSFSVVAKESEMLIVFSGFDGEPFALRMNPDIVLNLGINLLLNGTELGWFEMGLENIDPPLPH